MSQQAEFANLDPTFPERQQPLTQADFARLLHADDGNISRLFDAAGINPQDDWREQLAGLWAYRAEQAAGRAGDGPLDLVQERARLAQAQADKTQFELRRLRGEFAPLALILDLMAAQATIVKTHLLATHNKIAGRFPTLDKKVIISIEDEIRESLTEVSNLRLPADLNRKFREWQKNGSEPGHDDKISKDDAGTAKDDAGTVSKVSRRERAETPKAPKTNRAPRAGGRRAPTRKSDPNRMATAVDQNAAEPQV